MKRLRIAAGFATAADAARAMPPVKLTTYYHHENGRRRILPDAARLYAGYLGVRAGYILFGER